MAAASGRQGRSESRAQLGHRRTFLRPCLLLLVDEEPTHGYVLPSRLQELTMETWDHGTIYRALNGLEDEGMVVATWERSEAGPSRRQYELTEMGRSALACWLGDLRDLRDLLTKMLLRHTHTCDEREEVRASAPAAPRAPEAPAEATQDEGDAAVIATEEGRSPAVR